MSTPKTEKLIEKIKATLHYTRYPGLSVMSGEKLCDVLGCTSTELKCALKTLIDQNVIFKAPSWENCDYYILTSMSTKVAAKRKRRPRKNPKRNRVFSLIVDAGIALGVRSAAGELFQGSPWYVPFAVTWFAMALYFIAKTQS